MNRPTGVTIIAILQFLGAAICVLAGIGLIVGGSMLGAMLSSIVNQSGQASGAPLTTIMAGLGIVLAVVCFVFAAIWAITGWGMWSVKNWARILTMVFCCIGILFALLGGLLSLLHFSVIMLFFVAIRIAICGVILWYLLQPDVKSAFESGGRRIAATA